jgi:hypothetical protein
MPPIIGTAILRSGAGAPHDREQARHDRDHRHHLRTDAFNGAVLDPAQASATALRLSICPADNFHQFRDLAALISSIVAADRVFHAVGHVIPENFFLDTAQGRLDRGDLSDDIDAVAVLVDHLRETANLAFDAVQPFLARRLDVLSHGSIYPPRVRSAREGVDDG